ncbi:phosphoglycerate mutase [Mrakia frigida]|uniref:2,3-bisphosphoglycerate-independent phosphoglycerate mutase n=1 Tax=Mrakia frigida TaxID=29902 RepID=UPI003FCC1746
MVAVNRSVHDGWGIAASKGIKGNAIENADTTNMDSIAAEHDHSPLQAHGLAVGLSDGLMGNSEVGHLNIGAGRIVWQDIVRIDQSIKTGEFYETANIVKSFKHAKETNGRLHLLGLVSDGGVHSHIHHLKALLKTAKQIGVPKVYIHFFGDGRDTAPRSAAGYMQELLDFIALPENGVGEIATVIGRYYAMDRDKRWERVKLAVDGLVGGVGEASEDPVASIEANYKNDVTDEFLKPIVVGGAESRIKDDDTLFFFNYRSDRVREIVQVFGVAPPPMEVSLPKNLNITTMSRYNSEFPFPIAFPPTSMDNVLAEWLAKKGAKQCHIAETENHITFFFNGGVEKQFENEVRHMIPSPKVATYDKQPEMSVQTVADKVAEVVKTNEFEFIMCNFAPPDMVGHTGVYDAAVKAIGATDKAVKTVYEACEAAGYVLLVTSDHGNAEQMLNAETGNPHTAHTTNPVPFIMTGKETKGLTFVEDKEGVACLADVAPTVLAIMGIEQPKEMTGKSLLAPNDSKRRKLE